MGEPVEVGTLECPQCPLTEDEAAALLELSGRTGRAEAASGALRTVEFGPGVRRYLVAVRPQ